VVDTDCGWLPDRGGSDPVGGSSLGADIACRTNQDVDHELDAARMVATPDERFAHYRNVAEHTLKELSIIYLYHQKWLRAFTNKLTVISPLPDGLIRPQGLQME
jgi:hypothetical protein